MLLVNTVVLRLTYIMRHLLAQLPKQISILPVWHL